MDLFEFTEALRRQKKLLIVGAALLIGLVAFLGFDFSGGLSFRAKPRFESSIQLAVVPAEYDSLASTLSNPGGMAGTAALYATLLAAPETAAEIAEETGVQLLATLQVTSSGRDGFIGVKATAPDAGGARKAALHSFAWLEQRLAGPLAIVRLQEQDDLASRSILDDQGQFVGAIRLDVSPAFAETATGLWTGLTAVEPVVSVSLADAAERPSEHVGLLEPGGDLLITLEDVFGNQLDAITTPVPLLPGPDTVPYALTLRLDRGALDFQRTSAVVGTTGVDDLAVVSDPELVERHIDVNWQRTLPAFGVDEEGSVANAAALLLLTEDPVAFATGARRGPVLVLAVLVGGFFALLALAIAVDTWSQARRKGREEKEVAGKLLGMEVPQQVKAK